MKKDALTAKQVEHMKPGVKRLEVAAGPPSGLYLVVHTTGRKSWMFRYRFRGRTRGLTFETAYPDMTLAAARAEAEAARASLEHDIDPAEVKAEEQRRPDSAQAVAAEWITRYLRPNTRTWPEVQRILDREVLPDWKGRLISEVGRADILRLLDSIVDSGRPVLANRTLSILKRWFNWCTERGIREVSPAAGIRPPAKERSRDRVLEPGELVDIWTTADVLGFPFGPFVQLLTLTAQRRSEVANMKWEDIDLDAGLWTLPAAATKPGRIHDVPLSSAALSLLQETPHFEGPYVFTTTSGKRPISGFSKAKVALDVKITEARKQAASDWRIHDLRRTAATWMAGAGVPPHVLSALLNHSPGTAQGVTSIYNRFRYVEERRRALEAWARYVFRLMTITTVATQR